LLGLVVIFFLAREFVLSPDSSGEVTETADGAPASIAVLPFEDFSEEKDQEYFSKGISEEILNLLAKTNALRVAARTSSFALGGGDLDIREIGKKLDVDTVLEGSIRKSGPNIRITAQLINVDDGYHLWSETYDRNYSDIFRIQDEIATEILDALKVHLMGDDAAPVHDASETAVDLEAYNAYLIGKERLALRTRDDILAGRAKFEEALAIDANYAPAHVGIAHADLLLEDYKFGGEGIESDESDAAIRQHLEAALALAPQLPEVVGVNGYYHLQRFRFDEAESALNEAISLNPSYALAYTWRARTLNKQSRYLDMLADLEKAYSLDPMSLEISEKLAFAYRSFWRPRDAERVIDRMFDLHPGHPLAYDAALENLQSHGRLGEALLTAERGLVSNPDDKNLAEWRAWVLLQVGLFDEAMVAGDEFVSFNALMMQGKHAEAKALLDQGLSGENPAWWAFEGRWYERVAGGGPDGSVFNLHLDTYIADLEERNIEWRETCNLSLITDLRDSGREADTESMMARCFEEFEERLKVGYLCPCTFFGLVWYTILDGRIDEAVERTDQWLSNGDSQSYLPFITEFQKLSDRPEYPGFLARNDEQLERQRRIYLTGLGELKRAETHP